MRSTKRDIGGSRDIISHLPEEVICLILSFLPTKDVASTSVLSRKWRRYLALVPNLRFDNSFYFHLPMTKREREENIEGFTSFVNNVLVKQAEAKAPLKMFHLKCQDIDNDIVFDWVRRVLDRSVLDIDISTSSSRNHPSSLSFNYLLPEIFVSETLVRLKLDFVDAFSISVEGDVSLPKLKTLHLDYFKIRTTTFNKLLSGCHVLEELLLLNLMWDSKENCVIVSVPTLQRIRFCRYEAKAIQKMSMSFDNPNLVYIEYYDTIAAGYEKMSFDSLVEANLGLRQTYSQDKINLAKIFTAICNVKILYLSDDTLKALACCCDTIPVFDNLVQLTIKTAQYVGWKSLPFLLKNCPILETLVFEGLHHKYTDKCDEDGCLCQNQDEWNVKGDVNACFSLSSVKVLKILEFGEIVDDDEAIEDQIEHVKNLLETMPNLEKMFLYYTTTPYDDEDVVEVTKQLQTLPRIAAAKCNVQIISDKFESAFTMFS